MTHYIRAGASFRVIDSKALNIHEKLPVGTYTVNYDKMAEQYYLDMVEDLTVSGKIYGDTLQVAERILTTFDNRDKTTGVMLAGEQGSGKTLLAKVLSSEGLKQGIPTIVINQPWFGEQFNLFMQTIEQPTVILFDEFEKTYNENEHQEALLTLFDGVYPSKKLFIITCNNSYRVNEHLKNRPGRIYYRKDYKGLDRAFIEEYCQDNLTNKDHIDAICKIAVAFSEFNFDILKAMVEEMNRYGETPQQVMKFLNARPELSGASTYDGVVTIKKKNFKISGWRGSPLSGQDLYMYVDTEDIFPDHEGRATFNVGHLKRVDAETGQFYFENEKGETLSLSKKVVSSYNPDAY